MKKNKSFNRFFKCFLGSSNIIRRAPPPPRPSVTPPSLPRTPSDTGAASDVLHHTSGLSISSLHDQGKVNRVE